MSHHLKKNRWKFNWKNWFICIWCQGIFPQLCGNICYFYFEEKNWFIWKWNNFVVLFLLKFRSSITAKNNKTATDRWNTVSSGRKAKWSSKAVLHWVRSWRRTGAKVSKTRFVFFSIHNNCSCRCFHQFCMCAIDVEQRIRNFEHQIAHIPYVNRRHAFFSPVHLNTYELHCYLSEWTMCVVCTTCIS